MKTIIDQLREGPDHDVEKTHRLMLLAADLIETAARGFDPMRDVEEFHRKFQNGYEGKPRLLPGEMNEFRQKFLREELKEYTDAIDEGLNAMGEDLDPAPYLEKALDALIDLTYVAIGTSHLHGFNFREGWRRVHVANMRKERATSAAQSTRNYAGDVIKPPGWVAPSHADLVADHAHAGEDRE